VPLRTLGETVDEHIETIGNLCREQGTGIAPSTSISSGHNQTVKILLDSIRPFGIYPHAVETFQNSLSGASDLLGC
jgi:hypothetical protein